MITLYLLHSHAPARPIATGFTPEDPPSVCWLWDLIRAEPGAKMSAAELRELLKSGRDVVIGDNCLHWSEE